MRSNSDCLVLVVEDDPSIAEFVQWLLRDEGYQVRVARDAAQALRELTQARPALVLLDLLLPGVSGARLLEDLRQRYGSAVRVMVMTASREEATRPGTPPVDGILLKPFELTDLLREVRRLVGEPACPR